MFNTSIWSNTRVKYNIMDIGGAVAKQDDRYVVKDNATLKNLILSSTWLET